MRWDVVVPRQRIRDDVVGAFDVLRVKARVVVNECAC